MQHQIGWSAGKYIQCLVLVAGTKTSTFILSLGILFLKQSYVNSWEAAVTGGWKVMLLFSALGTRYWEREEPVWALNFAHPLKSSICYVPSHNSNGRVAHGHGPILWAVSQALPSGSGGGRESSVGQLGISVLAREKKNQTRLQRTTLTRSINN